MSNILHLELCSAYLFKHISICESMPGDGLFSMNIFHIENYKKNHIYLTINSGNVQWEHMNCHAGQK